MVLGVFPALKLGVLFVKQISKPLAQLLVNQAKNHPVFRTYFIIPPAQFYHWAEVKAKMYVMNLGKPAKVAKLNETMAIELGANLMGEVIIFSVAGGCLILEYNRQVAKEAKKEEDRLAQLKQFTDDIESLSEVSKKQEAEIQYLHKVLEDLAHKSKLKLPPREDKEPRISNPSPKTVIADQESWKSEDIKVDKHSATNYSHSLVERAIVYYENDVKTDKLS